MSRLGTASTLAAAILLAAAPAPSKKAVPPPPILGPEPDWPTFRRIAEAGIAAQMIDPESARFSWISAPVAGDYKPLGEKRAYGYVACGTVNARNRMGGYTGPAGFAVVVDHGMVLSTDIDDPGHGSIARDCAQLVAAGAAAAPPIEPPAPPAHTTDAPPLPSGFSVRVMAEGAYVTAVAPGSPAASAGITPGMVIASVNTIPLAGMGEAMTKVVAAAGGGATLTMVGGAVLTLVPR